jgi:hypothetical protein
MHGETVKLISLSNKTVVTITVATWPVACWDCAFKSRRGYGCLRREGCLLSGRGLCVRLITRPEESDRLWCI